MKVENNTDALNILKDIQQKIDDQVMFNHGFRFEISINNQNDLVEINGRRGYILSITNKIGIFFAGKTITEAVNNLIDFLKDGGIININKDENGSQFNADIYIDTTIKIKNTHVGSYWYNGW